MDEAGRAKPTAKAWPPKRVKRSAQVSMASSNWNPSIERPEPCATPSSMLITSAGLAVRSTTREARMPMTRGATRHHRQRGISRRRGRDRWRAALRWRRALSLGVTALAVEAFQFCGELVCPGSVSSAEELNDFGCDIHASGGVDAGCDAEGHVEAVRAFAAGSSSAAAKRARSPTPTGRRSSRSPSAAMTRFSPTRGTASAMVAMAAILRKLGSIFSRARTASWRSRMACASLSAMAAPQRNFSG